MNRELELTISCVDGSAMTCVSSSNKVILAFLKANDHEGSAIELTVLEVLEDFVYTDEEYTGEEAYKYLGA